MELFECVKSSLIEQNGKQGLLVTSSERKDYISQSLIWELSKEGYLFWYILHVSYYLHGIYDYITIIKLYHLYGKDVFKIEISLFKLYKTKFQNESGTISKDGFEILETILCGHNVSRKY